MFISTGQFVHDVLPGMMRGRPEFNALLVTYNDADLPESFPEGLTVRLVAGNPLEGDEALMRLISSVAEGDRYLSERDAGQRLVQRETQRIGNCNLVVVYLGLTQFDRALTHAMRIRRKSSAEHVVVLTCDCDKEAKARKLRSLMPAKLFSAHLLTSECGGCADLKGLAAGMAEVWPQVKKA